MKKKILLITILFLGFISGIKAQQPCQAGMMYFINGSTVQFYDSSWTATGAITSWSWSFPGGTPAASTLQNPVVIYSANGTYTVCLTITTSTGCSDTVCQVITVPNCTLSATLSFSNPTLAVTATGGTAPYTFLWSTGAITQSINVTTTGTYCVTVTDANSCSVTSCYNYTGGGTCNPYFNTNINGNTVQFMNGSSGNYASWIWNFGDGGTSAAWSPTHTYAVNGGYTVCLSLLDSLGNTLCQYCDSIIVPNGSVANDTLCGQIFVDANGNGVMDSTEYGWGGGYVLMFGSNGTFTAMVDSFGYWTGYVPDGTYTIYFCVQGQPVVFTIPLDDSSNCAFYDSVTVSGGGTFCGYNFGFQFNSVIIEGTVFIDTNNNGIKDAGEPGAPYQPVQVGSYSTYTNSNGFYSIWVVPGTYNITYTPSGLFTGYTLTTSGTITVNASVIGNTYGNNDFGIYIPPGSVNLSVNITPHTTVTPGFPAWYDIQVCNIGSNITGATLTMFHDPNLTFDYASPMESNYNAGSYELTWNVPVLTPGQCVYYWVHFDALASLQVGDNTFELVNVIPTMGTDIDMSNNTDSVHQVVTASWDPNNKLSVTTNYWNPNYQIISAVNPDRSIDYSINFQNLGTAPAVNVSVLDDLEAQLDGNSFQLMGTSHSAQVTRLGNQLTFLFANIMLPDATTNPPASIGFINFKVNSQNGLPAGTIIADDAAIYFDFNSAVITNQAVVELINPTGINEVEAAGSGLTVFPNPISDAGYVNFELKEASFVNIEVTDVTGKKVQQLINENVAAGNYSVKVNAQNLSSGLYLLKMETNNVLQTIKFSVK